MFGCELQVAPTTDELILQNLISNLLSHINLHPIIPTQPIMPDPKLISRLEPEIEDPEEETFLLYTQPIPSQNLGFIDRESRTVEVTVGDKEYTIHQSPSVLSSDRKGGTTGAVLWKVTPSFASWLVSPTNILFQNDVLNSQSAVLELGCGISPLNAFALSPRIATYTLSDQPYVQRFVEQNISENQAPKPSKKKPGPPLGKINFTTLDWETDTVTRALTCSNAHSSFDVVLACDCVFNYALIEPFVSACAD
ncbi:hypothetical protein Golomagni_08252, partial [Golovinomyces magnicellulatus]